MSGQAESAPDPDPVQDWWFTFGHGQEHFPGYVIIRGTFQDARLEMVRRYGQRWCMQYDSADAAGVEQWGLRQVHPNP